MIIQILSRTYDSLGVIFFVFIQLRQLWIDTPFKIIIFSDSAFIKLNIRDKL